MTLAFIAQEKSVSVLTWGSDNLSTLSGYFNSLIAFLGGRQQAAEPPCSALKESSRSSPVPEQEKL